MGRQVIFRTCPQDLKVLETMLRELGTCFLAYYHREPMPTLVETIDPRVTGEPVAYVTVPSLIPQVQLGYVKAQGYYLIDDIDSPVMELSRDARDDRPTRGRLYYQTGRFIDRTWVPHDRAFLDVAEAASNWIRRHFSKANKADREYEAPAARDWRLAHQSASKTGQ
jgi:hypothetical protein